MHFLHKAFRKAIRILKFPFRKLIARKIGVHFVKPNYIYRDTLPKGAIVIDAGCGHIADFSRYLMEKFDAQVYGLDPTHKHAEDLQALQMETENQFTYFPLAITPGDGMIQFHESTDNESGSVIENHINVKNDRIITYHVEGITLDSLVKRIGLERVDLIKLDLEGAEYELIDKLKPGELKPFDQIFLEFHHHANPNLSPKDTNRCVNKVREHGFRLFTFDDLNYLFYKE